MSQIITQETTCADCNHKKESHISAGVCSGSVSCQCKGFVEPILSKFFMEIEKAKNELRAIEKRCGFILEKIPKTRNAGEKTFYKIYIEIWHGFKIRKGSPSVLDTDTWKSLPNQDTINRGKRKCKQFHEELRTYNPEMMERQATLYQAVMEWAGE